MSPTTSTMRSSASASSVTVSLNCFRIELGHQLLVGLGRRRLAVPLEEVLFHGGAAVPLDGPADHHPPRVGRLPHGGRNRVLVVAVDLRRGAPEGGEALGRIR